MIFLLALFMGSLPLSVWIGKLMARADIRTVGDGNPGATNALRAGGWRVGLAALLLDVSKAAFPVGLAYVIFEMRGLPMFFIAIAPILGHIFSPFLGWRGGKGLATMLGVWIGLSLWHIPLVILSVLLIWFFLVRLRPDGWAVLATALTTLAYLLLIRADALWLAVMLAQLALAAFTHRADLAQRPFRKATKSP